VERFVCIHGHFYQPPRENPWLEAVETQDSASPYHDWNERITAECYEPNATSRILDPRERILRIVNNYGAISFNFGPTLLSWLQEKAPATYAAIIDGDRLSQERYSGHGSAIAQAYNHIILPLASDRDKRTQVRWGIRDFEFRFGRRPEGMWLPETAVDVPTLEALAAEGIAFTILAPHQAGRTRRLGDKHWHDAAGVLDPTMPYACNLPSGRSVAIFFYDGPISRAVAFENLLSRGEALAHRLSGAFDPERKHAQLVNIATDGETYGHHHRFGDMALAYALQYIERHKLARLTNYGEFLALHPPTHEVEVAGETAWSCSHGVDRWRADCGCHTGAAPGWNQRWRGPLREALDSVRDGAAAIFESEGPRVLRDPWAARDDYIEVILDRSEHAVERFLSRHAHEGAPMSRALELLEMQRNAMLMYTSCGWFFNDISGIETVQVLNYAARVIQLAERFGGASLEPELKKRLRAANSNLPDKGTAEEIYERDIAPAKLDLRRVAAHYAVASLFDHFDDEAPIHCYSVTRHDFEMQKAGRARLAVGSITIRSAITQEQESFQFAVLHLGETELTGGVRSPRPDEDFEAIRAELLATMQPGGIPGIIRLLDAFFAETSVSISSLFRDEQRRIFQILCNTTLEEAESAFRQLHERYDPIMRFHTRLGIPVPKVLQMAAEFDLNVQLRALLEEEVPPLSEIEARFREARDEHVALDEVTRMAVEAAVERAAQRFRDHPEDLDLLEEYEALVSVIRSYGINVDMRTPQNDYYAMMGTVRPAFAASGNGSRHAERWLALFDSLGEKLSISLEAHQS
jgi:alpha-amylase/alpha-mannosidase (GH57 family)